MEFSTSLNTVIFTTSFLLANGDIQWADLLWMYTHRFIGWRIPIEFAHARFAMMTTYDELIFDLANLDKGQGQNVRDFLEELAARSPLPDELCAKKALYLALLWIYENRDVVDDPFGKVEEVFTDFEYPEEIRPFIRFLPPEDGYEPLKHTKEENYARMLTKWEEYLDKTRLNFGW